MRTLSPRLMLARAPGAIAAGVLTLVMLWQGVGAQAIAPYVNQITLVSSTRFDRTRTDFVYRIQVINPGGALINARATVTSSSANTVILDNTVTIGTLPAGSTTNPTDTFSFRQNRTVPFDPTSLTFVVTGTPANTPPVARASAAPQTAPTGTLITLDGSASTDADGDSMTYAWSIQSRPAGSTAALSSPTAVRPTFRIDRGGDYVFRLIVNDGQVNSDPVTVQVSTINSPPTANAGPDRTVPRGARVTLDGSASTDPDFDALNYAWAIVSAPTGSTATLNDPSLVSPSITLDRAGTYRFRLIVNDTRLESAPDEVVISTENSVPVADAGPDQIGTVNVRVTLDGSASRDADNDPISFAWTFASRPSGSAALLDTTNGVAPTFTPDRAGIYVVQLIVNDGFNDSTPDTMTVTVAQPPNRAPNARDDNVTTPANTPVDISVLSNDSDPDGDTITVDSFTQPSNGGTVARIGNTQVLRFTPNTGFSGVATFSYVATDGMLTDAATVTVTVDSAANTAPVVNAGADKGATLPYRNATVRVQLDGTVSDDGRPLPANLTSVWTRVSGPGAAVIGTPNAPVTFVEISEPGAHVFRLSASDGALTASDDVTVFVNAPVNRAPELGDIPDRTINLGESVRIQLSANDSDPFDTLTFALGAVPSGTTLSATGLLSWTPTAPGTASFTVIVRDQANLTDSESFTVTVLSTNRPPVLGPLADDTTFVNASYSKTLSATDPDGGAVTLQLLSGPPGLTLIGNTLAWRPGATQTGLNTVKVQARDSEGASTAGLFRITVNTTTPPLARDDQYSVRQGETLTVAAPGVLGNDASPEGRPLSSLKRSDPALGSLTSFNANGSFTFVAPPVAPMAPFAVTGRRLSANPSLVARDLFRGPVLGDLNRDGKPDLITGRFEPERLIATGGSSGDGPILWAVNPPCNQQAQDSPTDLLADIDDDGRLEFVHATRCPNEGVGFSSYTRLQALADDGQVKWTSPLQTSPAATVLYCTAPGVCEPTPRQIEWADATRGIILSVARLASGEAPTLLYRQFVNATDALVFTDLGGGNYGNRALGCRAMTGNAADEGQTCAVTVLVSASNGAVQQVLRSAPRPYKYPTGNTRPYARNSVIPVDLDGDGSIELVSGADVWRRSGGVWSLAWQGIAEPQQVAVADLDGDGRAEVVYQFDHMIGSFPGDPLPGFGGFIVYDRNGVELRRIPLPLNNVGPLSIADVDGDRRPELLITHDGIAHAINGDGTFKWSFTVPDNPAQHSYPVSSRTSPSTNMLAYDLDGDGRREVIFSSAGWVHFLDGRTGIEKARFDAGARVAGTSLGHTIIADWNDDGHADVISTAQFGNYPAATRTDALYVITSASNDWLPAGKWAGQYDHRHDSFDDAGRVLFDASTPTEFRNPKQRGTVRDPRETAGTSFTYAANDGLVDSNDAKVFIEITPANRPPEFTSTPPSAVNGSAGGVVTVYTPAVTDPDPGDTVTFTLQSYGIGFVGRDNTALFNIDPATGAVRMATGSGLGTYQVQFTITATDSQGAQAVQSFVVLHSLSSATVPNVVGQSLAAATQTLGALQLNTRVLQEQFSAQPAGTVIAQNVSAGSPQPRGATIGLTVSRGPQPVIVPNVVARSERAAAALLSGAGFTPAITRQYSTTVPFGVVISQSPLAGVEVAPGAASIVVSAGTGVVVRLSRDFFGANGSSTVQVFTVALDGTESPAGAATFSVTTGSGPSLGPVPTVSGSTLSASAATRGNFRLTATESATGRSGFADFTVGPPTSATDFADAQAISDFGETLAAVAGLLREGLAAGRAGNETIMRARAASAVQRWRALDQSLLRLSTPFSPEGGLPPLPRDLIAAGLSATAEDQINQRMLENGVVSVQAMIAGLRAPSTSFNQLDRLLADVVTAVDALGSNQPSELGLVSAHEEYRYLVGILLPNWMDALMDDIGRSVGIPPLASLSSTADPDSRAYVSSLLAEQLTVLALEKALEEINVVNKLRGDLIKQARAAAILVALAGRLRAGLAAQSLVEVVSGASLSFRRFQVGGSFIESFDVTSKYPVLNDVVLLGPSVVAPLQDIVEGITNIAPSNLAKSTLALKKLISGLKALATQGNTAARDGLQAPTSTEVGCVFTTAPSCGQLVFASGFVSVYDYAAPPPFPPTIVGLPNPIIVITRSATGQFYLSTPPFLPFRPGVD